MQIDNSILQLSLILIIVLCAIVTVGLSVLYRDTREWRYLSLILIPVAFMIVYLWIGFTIPSGEAVRNATRSVIMFSGFNAAYVIFTYIGKMRRLKQGKK